VVDNSSGEEETERVAREFGVRYTVEPITGLSRARNRGLSESNTDLVAYIDDDGRADEKWLGLLVAPFADPLVAVTTGETVELGSEADAFKGKPPRLLTSRSPLWFEIATFGGLGFGTNMVVRKSLCAGDQLFDVRLGRGTPIRLGEESHAFASLLKRGYSAVHVPQAIVIHPSSPRDVQLEASSSMAYWLLLFVESPDHRGDLLRFLFRRIRRVPLSWDRRPQLPGDIITSGWRVYLRAGLHALQLFARGWK
jgi:glycosyltransferase involved in cell wall biosynthesis